MHAGKPPPAPSPSVSYLDPCSSFPSPLRNSILPCSRPWAIKGHSLAWITSHLSFSTHTFFSNTRNISFLLWLSGRSLAGSLPSASAFIACQGGYSLLGCHHPLFKVSNKHYYTFFYWALGLGRDVFQTAAKLHHYPPSKLLFKFSFAIRLKKKNSFDITQTTRVYFTK